jgi:hypothetical protein
LERVWLILLLVGFLAVSLSGLAESSDKVKTKVYFQKLIVAKEPEEKISEKMLRDTTELVKERMNELRIRKEFSLDLDQALTRLLQVEQDPSSSVEMIKQERKIYNCTVQWVKIEYIKEALLIRDAMIASKYLPCSPNPEIEKIKGVTTIFSCGPKMIQYVRYAGNFPGTPPNIPVFHAPVKRVSLATGVIIAVVAITAYKLYKSHNSLQPFQAAINSFKLGNININTEIDYDCTSTNDHSIMSKLIFNF